MYLLEQVKKIPIIDVAENYLPELTLTEYGAWYKGLCPFHEDTDPSFSINAETNSWCCYGCKKGGSSIDLIMETKGLGVWEAAKELAREFGIQYEEISSADKEKYEAFAKKQNSLGNYITWAHSQLGPEQRQSLIKRGLTDKEIDEFKIGYDPGMPGHGEDPRELGLYGHSGGYIPSDRIVIPVFQYGKPIFSTFWEYKNKPGFPKYLHLHGWEKPLAGMDLIRKDKLVYVVEGIFDWFSMVKSGYIAVCLLGNEVKARHLEYLKKASHVYIMLDSDESGQNAANELTRKLYPVAKNIIIPGFKDPNELYQSDPEGFTETISKLSDMAKDYVDIVMDRVEAIPEVTAAAVQPFLTDLALVPLSGIHRDIVIERLYKKLKTIGVTKKAIQSEFSQTTKENSEGAEGKESCQDTLLRLAGDAFLFRDQSNKAQVKVPINDHYEIYRCSSKNSSFLAWLGFKYYKETGRGPSSEALTSAINTMAAKAIHDGNGQFRLHNRTDEYEEAFWYDLADEQWRAVKITPEGWNIIDDPPILFRRYSHQQAHQAPDPNGDVKKLLDFVNLKNPELRLLYLVNVVTSFIPDIAHAIFVLYGSEGSGKSMASKVTRRIIDPSAAETCGNYKDKKEFTQHLDHNYLIILENLTNMSKATSDDICAAVTGDGFSKRELYTDDEDIIYSFKRTFIINGINNVATQADLLRRSVLFELAPLPNNERKEERVFWEQFEAAKPYILGGVFNTLSKAMKIYPEVNITELYSLADYTRWGYAVSEALGHSGQAFLNAYADNQSLQADEAITNDPVAWALTLYMSDKEKWTGTASGLLSELEEIATNEKIDMNARSWPKAGNSLSRRLNECRTVLQKKAISVDGSRNSGNRTITIKNNRYPKANNDEAGVGGNNKTHSTDEWSLV